MGTRTTRGHHSLGETAPLEVPLLETNTIEGPITRLPRARP